MRSMLLLILLSLAGGTEGSDRPSKTKAESLPPVTTLALASAKVTSTPQFPWLGAAQCDADGNIFWHSTFQTQELKFLKLRTNGSTFTYHPADSKLADLDFVSYYVTSDGDLFALATERNNWKTLYLLKAGDDDSSFSSTKLDIPDGVQPITIGGFAVTPGGVVLIHGYFDNKAPKKDRGRAYFITFDTSGRLLRRSSGQVSDSVRKFVEKDAEPLPMSPAVGGDGLIYVLEPERIVAVSQAGEVARTIALHPPKDGYDQPFDLRAAGSRLLLTWQKGGERMLMPEYELLDAMTGEVLRLYRPGPEVGTLLVCFTGDSLIFDGGRDEGGHIKIVTAPAN